MYIIKGQSNADQNSSEMVHQLPHILPRTDKYGAETNRYHHILSANVVLTNPSHRVSDSSAEGPLYWCANPVASGVPYLQEQPHAKSCVSLREKLRPLV